MGGWEGAHPPPSQGLRNGLYRGTLEPMHIREGAVGARGDSRVSNVKQGPGRQPVLTCVQYPAASSRRAQQGDGQVLTLCPSQLA